MRGLSGAGALLLFGLSAAVVSSATDDSNSRFHPSPLTDSQGAPAAPAGGPSESDGLEGALLQDLDEEGETSARGPLS